MTNTIILMYILMTYGLTNLLVFGNGPFDVIAHFRFLLFKIHKTFEDMLSCMMCTSANVGWILSALNIIFLPTLPLTPFNIIINDPTLWYIIVPLDLFITSGTVWLIHNLEDMLERINNNNKE